MSSTPFSQQTGHKYTFQLQLKKLYISPSLPFQVKIIWARGQNRIQSQNAIKLQPPQNQITLQQCFCNKSTVLFNPKKLQFRKKQSRIQVILYANGSPKQGGEYVLNLCEILDPYNIKKQQQKTYRVVTRQQKPRCEIEFKLTAEYCQQMIRDEQRSIGSGVGSISSKNTTSMGYGGSNALNFDAKQYVQKKNLFLYEAPSKDNQSVVSYNSYSTNMMRYQSGNKKQRNDSIQKQEYGLATTTRINSSTNNLINDNNNVNSNTNINNTLFSKTTSAMNMKSLSGQFDTRSRGGYNRVTQQQQQLPPHYNNNFDNRTQNFDNTSSNRQLQQQQHKRSKLQAQVSKLNIYMKQQSNKLTEYIQENTRLKEQLNRMGSEKEVKQKLSSTLSNEMLQRQNYVNKIKQQYQQQLQLLKKQNQLISNKKSQLTNENKQINYKLQQQLYQRQQIDQQFKQIKIEKQRAQAKFQSLNRNMQSIITNKQMSIKQVQNLKDELQHVKGLNTNLRDTLEKQRRRTQQLQMNSNYQNKSVDENIKKMQQRIYQLQRQNTTLMTQVRDRQTEVQTKKQLIYRLQKTSTQYKDKILISDSEKSKLLLENASIKNQNDKLRLQMSSNNGVNDMMRKELDDKKNQIYRLEANVKGLKDIESKFYYLDKMQGDKQRQVIALRQENSKFVGKMNQLEQQCRKLLAENDQLKKHSLSVPNVDVNQILRESVQMQVQLKFKTDQLVRLKNIQEKFNDLIYRLQMEEKSRKQVQQEMQKLQKQVKDKNKLYLIEVEKGKIIIREKTQLQKEFQQIRNELKRCQEIIFNGDRQVKEMQSHINFLQNQNTQLNNKLASSQNQLNLLLGKLNDSSRLQAKIKQLSQEAQSASQKLIKMEGTHSSVSNELHKALAQKKSLQLKCQTIMQELHSLKKQYEDEKLRSTSVVSIRSNEDQVKIRQLQHQIDKKDKVISKLTKQKLEIQEQNINLHVQVMKKLSEMQKNKDISGHGNDSTVTPK